MKKGNAFELHKYVGKSTLRYKLGINILMGDIKIFNKVLRNFLKPGKQVEVGEGYCSHPDKIRCPGNDANLVENWSMQGRVRECSTQSSLVGRYGLPDVSQISVRYEYILFGTPD